MRAIFSVVGLLLVLAVVAVLVQHSMKPMRVAQPPDSVQPGLSASHPEPGQRPLPAAVGQEIQHSLDDAHKRRDQALDAAQP